MTEFPLHNTYAWLQDVSHKEFTSWVLHGTRYSMRAWPPRCPNIWTLLESMNDGDKDWHTVCTLTPPVIPQEER